MNWGERKKRTKTSKRKGGGVAQGGKNRSDDAWDPSRGGANKHDDKENVGGHVHKKLEGGHP